MLSNNAGAERFIGIDGGGTKTTCILGDAYGNILARCYGGSGNVKSRPREEVQHMLLSLIQEALAKSGSEPEQLASVMLGLAGGHRPEDKRRMIQFLQPNLPLKTNVTVQSDAAAALAAGSWGEAGIVLISGTGSIAFSYLPDTGESSRVGGWGYVLGDEGSGYQIGQRSLTAVLHEYDGRGEATQLTPMLLEQLSLNGPEQFIDTFYENINMRKEIAELTRVTFKAAYHGDRVALSILDEAIQDLSLMVQTAESRLVGLKGFAGLEQKGGFPLVLAGGLFQDDFFTDRFIEINKGRLKAVEVRRLQFPPDLGAYILALLSTGRKINDEMKQQLEQSWNDVRRLS